MFKMSGTEHANPDVGTVKPMAKRTATAIPPPTFNPTPTAFFIRTEKDVERSTQHRGRRPSRSSISTHAPGDVHTRDASFVVQSLEDTINHGLSRTDSHDSELSTEAGASFVSRKRKVGNPVHPKIMATGQRIISSEQPSPSPTASPTAFRSAESPLRTHLRRGSASSINHSQPLTPLRMSPHPESALASTPRSGSPKSFRLSDDEGSMADDTRSQAVESSIGDSDDLGAVEGSGVSSMPQLVMPSIAMPARRPFTERGKRMGRIKIMVIGPHGVGKTDLIQSICRICDDVVHVDPPTCLPSHATSAADVMHAEARTPCVETLASTRPYPSWWTDMESRRMLLRRKSMGEGVLERNLCFIDTPDVGDEQVVEQLSQLVDATMRRTASLESMNDSELISLLSGEGGVNIDAVLWLFDPPSMSNLQTIPMASCQKQLFQKLCKVTNVVPLIGRADCTDEVSMRSHKEKIISWLPGGLNDTFSFHIPNSGPHQLDGAPREPFAVSSAQGDDAETIDASVLMSSQYVAPLVTSELAYLTEQLLDPDNIIRMRHLAATKFLLWRHNNLGAHMDLHKLGPNSPIVTSTGSMLDETSKILVPYGSSSYYRSISPSGSDMSSLPADVMGTSASALARHNEQPHNTEQPFRQVRLAKWAQDLQRSLGNERRRYQQMYFNPPADWTSDDGEKSDQALVSAQQSRRPARGRLGGDMAVIDPRDPLGVLAFTQALRRRSFFALQLAGGFGLVGAIAFWVLRNWAEVQDVFGLGHPSSVVSVAAVPAPSRGWFDEANWRAFFGWDR